MLAKAAASATSSRFIGVQARHIMQSELGESEKMIRDIFAEARRSRYSVHAWVGTIFNIMRVVHV